MEDVEGQHRLAGVGEQPVFEIQILCAQAQHEDDRAPTGNAHDDFSKDEYQREGRSNQVWVVV